MASICTQPAGSEPRSVLVFSPHPDDDVISMGGTLLRLVDQGHKVHIAYMTSGNIAVFDHDAWRFTDFILEFNRLFGLDPAATDRVRDRVQEFLHSKRPGQPDSEDLLNIKALIRRTEAPSSSPRLRRAPGTARVHGPALLPDRHDLEGAAPSAGRRRPGRALAALQPSQIYVAGEMSDPHGTHRVCAEAIFQAVKQVRSAGRNSRSGSIAEPGRNGSHTRSSASSRSASTIWSARNRRSFGTSRRRTGPCFPAASTTASSGRGPRIAIATRPRYTISLGLPEFYALEAFVQWKGA